MTQYIIRDTVSGVLLGSPFSNNKFKWHGTDAICLTRLEHGLTHDTQKVYEIVETSEGAGSVVTVGLTYNETTDKVTRHTVRSKSQADLDAEALAEATAWLPARANGYAAEIADMKGLPAGMVDKVSAAGFVLDSVVAEIVAIRTGKPMTPEFTELLTRIAAVKAANPKPVA